MKRNLVSKADVVAMLEKEIEQWNNQHSGSDREFLVALGAKSALRNAITKLVALDKAKGEHGRKD